MRKSTRRTMSMLLIFIFVVAIAITGCGKKETADKSGDTAKTDKVDGEQVVATLGNEKIYLKEANFYAKLQQAQWESAYMGYFGEEMWSQDFYGDGKTLADTVKEGVMNQIKEIHTVTAHADDYKIKLTDDEKKELQQSAKDFMAQTDKKILEAAGATEEFAYEQLQNNKIYDKVANEVIKDVDTNVSDEEAAQKTISYVMLPLTGSFDAEGNPVAITEEEKGNLKEKAQGVADAVKAGADFDTTVKDAELTPTAASYGKGSADLEDEVMKAADGLTEGQSSDVIETKTGYYVVKLTSAFDQEATNTNKETVVNQRKQEAFEKMLKTWEKEAKFKIDDKVWKTVNFDTHLVEVPEPQAPIDPTVSSGEALDGQEQDGAADTGKDAGSAESPKEGANPEGTAGSSGGAAE